jgi:hypothetical protein
MTTPRRVCPVCFSAYCLPDQCRCPGCDAARNGYRATNAKHKGQGAYARR